jgi:hypothetical protein
MVETAAHLTDNVLPPLPVRRWVLSVPKRIRPFLHHNPAIASAALRIFVRAIRSTLRSTSPGASPGAQIGAVSFLHRFGSALNAHFHFHVCVIDGVFGVDQHGGVRFHEATHLTPSDWEQLQQTVRRRVLWYFHRHGLLERHVTDDAEPAGGLPREHGGSRVPARGTSWTEGRRVTSSRTWTPN